MVKTATQFQFSQNAAHAFHNPFDFKSHTDSVPALHYATSLPPALTRTIDAYVARRDHLELTQPRAPKIDPQQKQLLRNWGLYTVPGWGNFVFGARPLNFAQGTLGHDVTHLSLNPEGQIGQRGQFGIIGDHRTSVTAEWVIELRTLIHRLWHSKKMKSHQRANDGDPRHIIMGHSKGGNLVYLLACLRQSFQKGELKEFVNKLVDVDGQPVLQGFPIEILNEVAAGLNSDLLGSIGAPLFGIGDEFSKIAKTNVFKVGFDSVTANSAAFLSATYMLGLHDMTGYKPNDVLDFVVTSNLPAYKSINHALRHNTPKLWQLGSTPMLLGADIAFNGLSRLIAAATGHDGVGPSNYPESFEHHIHLDDITHLHQAESARALHAVFAGLIRYGLIT